MYIATKRYIGGSEQKAEKKVHRYTIYAFTCIIVRGGGHKGERHLEYRVQRIREEGSSI